LRYICELCICYMNIIQHIHSDKNMAMEQLAVALLTILGTHTKTQALEAMGCGNGM